MPWRRSDRCGNGFVGVQLRHLLWLTNSVYPRSCEKWILKSIGRDWRKFKSSLQDAFFIPAIKKIGTSSERLCISSVQKMWTTINGVDLLNIGSREKEGPLLRRT